MKPFLLSLACIILVSANLNSIEWLSDKGYGTEVIMTYRSLVSAVLFFFLLGFRKRPIRIIHKRDFAIRAVADGLSIVLLVSSFRFLAAGTVSLIQRMDIPLFIIISVANRERKSNLQFYLSAWTIVLVAYFIAESKLLQEDRIGYLYAIPAVLLISLTHYIVKRQSDMEDQKALGLFYSASLLLWGIGLSWVLGSGLYIALADAWLFVAGGFLQFGIVYVSLALFRSYPSERARIPFTIAIIGTMILEMVIEKKVFSFSQVALTVILSGLLLTICLNPNVPNRKN